MPWEILRRDSPSHPGRLDVRVIVDEDKVSSMSRESLQMLEDDEAGVISPLGRASHLIQNQEHLEPDF